MGSPGLFIQIEGRSSLQKAGGSCGASRGQIWNFFLCTIPNHRGWSNEWMALCLRHSVVWFTVQTKWRRGICLLPTVELVVNSLPNSSTGFSPFYLNYGYEPVTPVELLRGDELAKTEVVKAFVWRVSLDWKLARENLERSVLLQAK